MKLTHIVVLALAVPGPLAAQAPVKTPENVVELAPLPANAAASLVKGIVSELKADDLVALQSRFDEALKAALPDDKLRGFWTGVAAKGGRLKSCTEPRIDWVGEYTLGFTTCTFEKQRAELKLTFHSDGRLAGMFLEAGGSPRPDWTAPRYVAPGAFKEREVQVVSGPVSLPGTLAMPAGDGPFPGVVLVHGSGPQDRDETIGGFRPFQDLAQGLASRGVAVLRYDKRTKVYQKELAGTRDMTIRQEVIDDALAAVHILRSTPRVDPKRVFVAGHSLGAILAPRIGALDGSLAGIVLLAAPSRPMSEVIRDQARSLLEPGATEAQRRMAPDVLKEANALADLYAGRPGPPSGMVLGASVSYWLDLKSQLSLEAARSFGRPILVLQGERDHQVSMADFSGWKKELGGRPGVVLKSYPALNHLFAPGEGRSTPAEYEKPGHVAAEVVEDIAAFVKKSPPAGVP
ncbi:MAG TPA: alpha/beta fold hydrolase [Thermoanaerobaculia bacterium]|nr:alpha/beta fold hydrolase [Thermoanaerobaculia bacterium]